MKTLTIRQLLIFFLILATSVSLAACGGAEPPATANTDSEEHSEDEHGDEDHGEEGHDDHEDEDDHDEHGGDLELPHLEAAALDGASLSVVATTSIIADVVANVGGDAIALTALMGPGQDPHGFEPAAQDLTAVADANVIFVNGWNLEEGLISALESIAEDVPLVAISAGIEPLEIDDAHDGHGHGAEDPHVWLSIHNVEKWVSNVTEVLSDLDPANAETYAANAAAYVAELEILERYTEEQIATIPTEKRFLVTNHDSFSYLAADYDFQVLGTILPNASTISEPSASDLASLITEMDEHSVCTIFSETTVSDSLAQTVADELSACDDVQLLPLYTGAVGPAGSGAETYIGMFTANVDALVAGLGK